MAFQLSPGVLVTERDLTLIVPAVSSTAGAFVGAFQWGPVDEVVQVDSENVLVDVFGQPNDNTFASFFTAANFLSYGNNLQVIRAVNKGLAKNAISNSLGVAQLITNDSDYDYSYSSGNVSLGPVIGKYPGVLGNSLQVSIADGASFSNWLYGSQFDSAPSTSLYVEEAGGAHDELHIIVIDEDGLWTGSTGTVLEKFANLSKASDAKKFDGSTNYYKNVLNNSSKYVFWGSHASTVTNNNWGQTSVTTFGNLNANVTVSLAGGVSADVLTDGNIMNAFNEFANDELYDISLIPLGNVSTTVATFVINNICEVRKDCIAFVSPNMPSVVGITSNSTVTNNITSFRDGLPSSSYGVMDSGFKYQYDRYNDVYRYVPCNGDTAGTVVRTDFTNDPWFSPAGFNRGQIKNVVKLAYSPRQTDRDTLYKKGVNPIVTFPGQGTVLFGDKTLLAKPSAFDRINVRRLFIVLEKAIATASKFQLFEFNDAFTRSQFRNLVEPFLRDVQGRRGVTDFKVVCDETNNTGEVIDRNEFVADIFIKPARAINFIRLNFIATRTGINFEEVGA
jgi:phage tail sheath protein FI